MKKQTTNRIVHGISFEPAILEGGKKKARENRQSLSAYICGLIFLDLKVNNKLTTSRKAKA